MLNVFVVLCLEYASKKYKTEFVHFQVGCSLNGLYNFGSLNGK